MKVILLNRQNKIDMDISLLKKVSSYVADKFNTDKNVELNIVFIEAEEMSILNKKYRNEEGPTDVLSFSYCNELDHGKDVKDRSFTTPELFDTAHGFTVAGEVIICPEAADENAKKNNPKFFSTWGTLREIIVLIIHGILHIYDYDHESRDDRLKMESIQNSILNDVVSNFNV